ncbi:hypothetical protein LCGC14_1776110 [marine sediment metagenome]|uniref:Uncharacterized protein n=1 Tax=marine sediment metagenome TaxID=412755 RepID=A0A0F9GX02_9ZZZZ|nr:hypothetical protein [Candidatus Scalindua sp.]
MQDKEQLTKLYEEAKLKNKHKLPLTDEETDAFLKMKKQEQKTGNIIAVIFVGLVACWMFSSSDSETKESKKCYANDLQCIGSKHNYEATIACKTLIASLGAYGHEWVDGILDSKLSYFRWRDIDKSEITYIGDKIKFYNMLGNAVPYKYECDYSVIDKKVLDVRAKPGNM